MITSWALGLLLLPNAKAALMRSPRIALKKKGLPESQARRMVVGIKLSRATALPVVAAAPALLQLLLGTEPPRKFQHTPQPQQLCGTPSRTPSWCRQDNRRHSRSKSKPPKREGKDRKREPFPYIHQGAHWEADQECAQGSCRDYPLQLWENKHDWRASGKDAPSSFRYACAWFENPDEAQKALKHTDGGQMCGWEDPCHHWAGPLASATHQAIQPCQENVATASQVAQVTLMV